MRDRASERTLGRCTIHVHVYPLVISSGLRELVHALLRDLMPLAVAEMFAYRRLHPVDPNQTSHRHRSSISLNGWRRAYLFVDHERGVAMRVEPTTCTGSRGTDQIFSNRPLRGRCTSGTVGSRCQPCPCARSESGVVNSAPTDHSVARSRVAPTRRAVGVRAVEPTARAAPRGGWQIRQSIRRSDQGRARTCGPSRRTWGGPRDEGVPL